MQRRIDKLSGNNYRNTRREALSCLFYELILCLFDISISVLLKMIFKKVRHVWCLPKGSQYRVCLGFVLSSCFAISLLYYALIDGTFGPLCSTQDRSSINSFRSCSSEAEYNPTPIPFPTLKKNGNFSSKKKGADVNQLDHIDLQCLADGRLNELNSWNFEHPNSSDVLLNKEYKTILVMVGNYGFKDLGFGFGHKPFETACCKEKRCFLTDNRKLLPIKDYDAMLFHYRTFLKQDLPRERSDHQRYMLFDWEPSGYLYQNPKIYDGVFNWTTTFRRDSDIPSPYGRTIPNWVLSKNFKPPKMEIIQKEVDGTSALVTWFVSRCSSVSWREHFIENLQQFIQVDIYGGCGPLKCTLENGYHPCLKMVEEKYKFYLSFENSLCQDYVTEKFFNILRFYVVPVVYGGADYSLIAPPHSYINALDFPDTKALAEYLLYLDKNDTAYNEYFKWKEDYTIPTVWINNAINFCYLCHKLHEDTSTKTYDDLGKFLEDDAKCQRMQPASWFEKIVSSNR